MSREEMTASLQKALSVRDKLKQALANHEAEVRTLQAQLETQLEALKKDFSASSLEELEQVLKDKEAAIERDIVTLNEAMNKYEADQSCEEAEGVFGKEFGDV